MTRRELFAALAVSPFVPAVVAKAVPAIVVAQHAYNHVLTITPRTLSHSGYRSCLVDVLVDGGRNGSWPMYVSVGDTIRVSLGRLDERVGCDAMWLGEPIYHYFGKRLSNAPSVLLWRKFDPVKTIEATFE